MGSVLENHAENIVNLINNGATYSDVSTALASIGIERGHSVASIKKFLGDRNLVKRGHLSDDHLEVAVASAIREVSLFFIILLLLLLLRDVYCPPAMSGLILFRTDWTVFWPKNYDGLPCLKGTPRFRTPRWISTEARPSTLPPSSFTGAYFTVLFVFSV